MVIEYILFFLGIFLLIKSAGWIIEGSVSLAKKLKVSALIIGLTVVAFGTSLPELIVNLFAAFNGSSEIIFGNIVGSNIANIFLVLGTIAIISNVTVKTTTVWKQIPFALLAAIVLFFMTSGAFFGIGDDLFTFSDGLILLSLFAIFIYDIFKISVKERHGISHFKKDSIPEKNLHIFIKLFLGLIGIYLGGKWVVSGAVLIASQLGFSEFLISATIIALGTSLPELVVSVVAALKKNVDLAVGNIVGSNIFNIFWVLGIVPLVGPLKIPPFIVFDIAVMFFATLLLFIFMFTGRHHEIRRKEGIVFILLYVLYITFIIIRG
jgi:cation:H+ antiporter